MSRLLSSGRTDRLFRVLAAAGFVAERGVGLYGPTKWTRHLSARTTEGFVSFMCVHIFCLSHLPAVRYRR